MSEQLATKKSAELRTTEAAATPAPEAQPSGPDIKSLPAYESTKKKLGEAVQKTTASEAEQMLAALAQCSGFEGVMPQRKAGLFLEGLISRVDEVITEQLNEVMHAQEFLKLEGTWRGMQRLLGETDSNATLWVEMLNATKDELRQDFADAGSNYKLSHMWDHVYTKRYDVRGGTPFGAFVSGFDFRNLPSDLELMKSFSQVGAATQAVFALSAAPELLGLRSFTELNNVKDLKNVYNNPEYTDVNAARTNPDFRFIALTMPRVLARLPYGSLTIPADGLAYEEAPIKRGRLEKMPHAHLCWSSSAYAFGGVLTKAFRKTNWCTAIMGEERKGLNGGVVGDLPLYKYYNEGGNVEVYPPTETEIPGDKEFTLAEMGLLPLSYHKGSDKSLFVGGKTAFKITAKLDTDNYQAEFVNSMLTNVLPASRISQYMKVIGRQFHGQFSTGKQLKEFMEKWLANFKGDETMGDDGKTKYPLRAFEVKVEDGYAPGIYDARLKLKFWDMIYRIDTDVEISAEVEAKQ